MSRCFWCVRDLRGFRGPDIGDGWEEACWGMRWGARFGDEVLG